MKFSLSWLKEFLQTDASIKELSEKLTAIGLEVESISNIGESLKYFSVAKIQKCFPHPESSKLKVCLVETIDSKEPLQIICGAANARENIKVAYAPINSIIPANQLKIKKSKIAGIESNGMLCSAKELMISNEDEGIIEIDDKFQIGDKISDIFNLSDPIFEINVTPNRGDCLSVFGIARDLSATKIGKLIKPEIVKIPAKLEFPLKIENNDVENCSKIAFRKITNVKNISSPKWLKDKLESIGINSISAIVDITNYVMISFNRPLHAYDCKKISGDSLIIRNAKGLEKFTSLKNNEYLLDEKILTISDSEKILSIAGVIGSLDSGCDNETSEIILESAFFSPSSVAYSSRKLNILTDSKYRFERNIDAESCVEGIEIASKLILEICGGEVSEIKFFEKDSIKDSKKINFDITKIKKLIGVEVDKSICLEVLANLGFAVKEDSKNHLSLTVPSYRNDINSEADLIEEILRIIGYQEIKSEEIAINQVFNNYQEKIEIIRNDLARKGIKEIISWSFISDILASEFCEINENLILQNPISSEMNYMRPNLLIGLLTSIKNNKIRNFNNFSLFEIGNIFENHQNSKHLSIVKIGKIREEDHFKDNREIDFFDIKKDFLAVVENFGVKRESLEISSEKTIKHYHPYRFASAKLGREEIGFFGEIHPKILKKFNIKNRVFACEILIDNLSKISSRNKIKNFQTIDFPAAERDFSFYIDSNLAVEKVINLIKSIDKNLIKDVILFDIYFDKSAKENELEAKKSISLRVKIQDQKTLTTHEIDDISKKIIDLVEDKFSAKLRSEN
jgi:phenylalanyl-tRNA synthetase beta chain